MSWEGLGRVLGGSWGPFGMPSEALGSIFEYLFDIFMDFRRIVKNMEKSGKSMKIWLEKLRDTKNEAERCPGRLREQQISHYEAPSDPKRSSREPQNVFKIIFG